METPQIQREFLNINECGAPKNGVPQTSEKRLYLQLQVFTNCLNPESLLKPLRTSGFDNVLYIDINDPQGIGLLSMTENPGIFAEEARSILASEPLASLKLKPEMTMTGRTYSTGRESDLEDWLHKKPRRNALNPQWPWAISYPIRRKPEFELLPKEEQGKILYEHAKIGIAFGQADYAHDIRLACHGLDKNDNEFVLGLIGRDLYPLSKVVQEMRKTQQTAKYMQSLGPFFVGKVFWQSPLKTS